MFGSLDKLVDSSSCGSFRLRLKSGREDVRPRLGSLGRDGSPLAGVVAS